MNSFIYFLPYNRVFNPIPSFILKWNYEGPGMYVHTPRVAVDDRWTLFINLGFE